MTRRRNGQARDSEPGQGIGVDFKGGPVIDPTQNVRDLSEALSQRQDDLRDLNNKYLDARLAAVETISNLRANHSKEIRVLEADRLEKIRQVDVSNTAIAAAQQLAAIQTLAATATTTAETLRTAVANTATTIQNQTDRIIAGINERMAALEKTANLVAGRAGVADPQNDRLTQLVEALARTQAVGSGKAAGLSQGAAILIAAVGLIATLLVIARVLFTTMKP